MALSYACLSATRKATGPPADTHFSFRDGKLKQVLSLDEVVPIQLILDLRILTQLAVG